MKATLESVSTTPAGNARKILGTSVKVIKGLQFGVLTAILYLSPYRESGVNLCPWASKGCAASCLGHSSGHLRFSAARLVRVAKSAWFRLYPLHFKAQLRQEIKAHAKKARRKGLVPAIRLNGSSDVLWERHLSMALEFPDVQFYDYTKAPLDKRVGPTWPGNYHLTYSVSEDPESLSRAFEYLDRGMNAAIVVRTPNQASQAVKDGLYGYPCIDGDKSDVRFEDQPGSWVVLYAKGAARNDRSGFVLDYDQQQRT